MNKKRFLWLALALAILAVTGYAGVRTAAAARAQAAALWGETAQNFTDGGGTPDYESYDFPREPYAARVDVVGTIAGDTGDVLTGDGYSHEATLNYIDALIGDENNVGMLLYIDSPGGEMAASDELYLKLMDYKNRTGRPIRCYFGDTACSGGYYVAMAADEITADRNCLCVNIGVYITAYDMSGLFEKLGVETVAVKSSENKGIGMAGVPWTDQQKAIYQSIVDLYYDQFLQVVADGRGMTKDQVILGNDGREMLAAQALEAGFVDAVARYQDYEPQVLADMGTELLYRPSVAASPWQKLLQYLSRVLPRSDTQALTDFAREHQGMVVMAYGG